VQIKENERIIENLKEEVGVFILFLNYDPSSKHNPLRRQSKENKSEISHLKGQVNVCLINGLNFET
jgi:hypothetical protein